jgi:putative transposase
MKAQLVPAALNMAVHLRNPRRVIHHSAQGTQYASIAFGACCFEAGIVPSMGSVGNC